MSECPAGVRRGEWRDLAMLVTDVEGSTHLARSYGERWGVTLAQYHEVLIRTVREHSGHVEHIEGDGALVLFADARSGLAAAVALQLALTAEGWSGPPLNTRMGLHFGPVSRPGAVLVGLEIHRAARVGSAANGGQVIVTERVQRDLVDCACLEDLGEFRLKDFPEAQRLFHVVIAGRTAADFPALRTAPVQPNNLPPEIGALYGRDIEVAQILDALRRERLVTVVGAGGVGKSRLAHAVAVDALDECEGGAWWVSLEPLGETSVVAAEIARALGASGPDAIAAVAARVAGRRTIVVLDNAEHLLPGVATEIARLLASTSDLTFLITSQRRLGVDVEFVIRVDQLVPGAARALFYERAAAARPDLRIPLDVVDAICSRADHHPLTLELAAGRLAVLSPAQLLDRMDRLLPLLGGAEAGRRKSLSGSVDWTLSLLDASTASIFASLGIFAGRVPIDFVEMVVDHPALLDGLQSLAELAIVRLDESGEGSPTLGLAPPLREVAVNRLGESPDRGWLAARHFEAVVAYVAAVRWSIAAKSSDRARAKAIVDEIRLAREWARQQNGSAELTLAACAGEFWAFSGRLDEGIAWLRRVTAVRAATEDWALAVAARVRVTCGLGREAAAGLLADADEAVMVLQDSGAREQAQSLIARALACAHAGLTDRAEADAASARDVAAGDDELLFIATVLSAHIHAVINDEVAGRALLDAAHALTPNPDLYLAGALPTLAGDFALMRGDGDAAAEAYAASLDWASRRHDLHQVTNDLAGLAAALAISGETERALEVLGIAERSAADLGRPVEWTGALAGAGDQHLADARRRPGSSAALQRGRAVTPGQRVARALQLHRAGAL